MADLNIKGTFLHEDIGGAVNPRHLYFGVCVDRDIGIVVDILEVQVPGLGAELALVAVAAGHGDGAGVGAADVEAGPERPLLRRHGPGHHADAALHRAREPDVSALGLHKQVTNLTLQHRGYRHGRYRQTCQRC